MLYVAFHLYFSSHSNNTMTTATTENTQQQVDQNIEIWKMKKLVQNLESARG